MRGPEVVPTVETTATALAGLDLASDNW
jgi:hypothetical protein